jgi:hypothetical protein
MQEDVVEIRCGTSPKNIGRLVKHLGLIKERHEISGDWNKWTARQFPASDSP